MSRPFNQALRDARRDQRYPVSFAADMCVGRAWQRMSLAIRRSLSEVSLAQLAGLDNRAPNMPIERELKYMARAKAAP